jgi:hypothetical protein
MVSPMVLHNEMFRSLYVRLSDKANRHCMLSAELAVGSGTFGVISQLSGTRL